ncbi:hypothetical protein [Curtobacterium sp. ZW137]|uniref:hypothetical protein n=1 Tax=Curtobacterium sp. ZW137 TaxID=2485104 RepID=UPI000F4D2704|nr:hypothetical protein [Curtobacterium sp. ZW137]ROP61111.1 hypothetical protein EDF55_3116 [Curtobacterium sp. ZW137]
MTSIDPRRGAERRTRHDVESLVDALTSRMDGNAADVRAAVLSVLHSREQQHLAEMELRRGIFELADLGIPQREIARLAGISQPEVSRRLTRRGLTASHPSPREVISQRQAGLIDSDTMVRELSTMAMTHRTPARDAGYDSAAAQTGTAKELAAAFQDGLISEGEYETVRKAIAGRLGRAHRR